MVKSPAVEALSPPNAKITTAGSPEAESLKIIAPFAVMVADEKVTSEKSVSAVVPLLVGVTLVNAAPLAVYPVPLTSFEVVYAVVEAANDAELV
tara:strand:- start:8593 stop:8874 length:282 start_codon:yes stop_codon:yes gene_type:complete